MQTRKEESVMGISGWMLLRLEEGVKVPKGGFHKTIGWHLREAHLEENVPELGSNLQQRMQMAAGRRHSHCLEVVLLELFVTP